MKTLVFILCFLIVRPIFSQVITAEQLSYGGAASLNSSSVHGLSLNPANLTLNMDLEGGATYQTGDVTEDVDQEVYHIWFKDSVANAFATQRNLKVRSSFGKEEGFPLAAAFAFSKLNNDLHSYKSYRLTLAKVLGNKWSVGSNISFLELGDGYAGSKAWMGTFGILYRLNSKLDLGLSWINALDTKEVAPTLYEASERLRLGLKWTLSPEFAFYADGDHHLDEVLKGEWSYGAGVSVKIKDFFNLRTGLYRKKSSDDTDLGVGLGFMGPKLKVSYGMRLSLDTKAQLHSIDLQLPLW